MKCARYSSTNPYPKATSGLLKKSLHRRATSRERDRRNRTGKGKSNLSCAANSRLRPSKSPRRGLLSPAWKCCILNAPATRKVNAGNSLFLWHLQRVLHSCQQARIRGADGEFL